MAKYEVKVTDRNGRTVWHDDVKAKNIVEAEEIAIRNAKEVLDLYAYVIEGGE